MRAPDPGGTPDDGGGRERIQTPPGMRLPATWRLIAWGIPAWSIFGAVWYLGITRQPGSVLTGLAVAAASIVVTGLLITGWVRHNKALARRREATRGSRKAAPDRRIRVHEDALGRRVEIAPGADVAREVTVRVEGGVKRIEPRRVP